MLPFPLFCPSALGSDILWPFRCVPYLLWLVPAFLSLLRRLLQKKSCDNFVSPFSPNLPMGTQAKAFIFSQAIHT